MTDTATTRPAASATVDDAAATVTVRAPAGWTLLAGDEPLAESGERTIGFEQARQLAWHRLSLRDAAGTVRPIADATLEGELFQAVGIATPEEFFERVQLNHLRFKSPFLLELGARVSIARFPASFEVQAAALTIMAHRLLDRPVESLGREDFMQIGWIVDRAELVVADGEKLIAGAGEKPQWQHVRWTVSLATVAGYLSLIEERVGRAIAFFAVCVRHVPLVAFSKVSALNFVNGCFVHGLLCASVERADDARASLTTGLKSLPAMVSAQDMMANVWVVGDLLNVMRSARQCFIALARFNLLVIDPKRTAPVIDPGTQIELGEIKSPLGRIIAAGRVPVVGQMLALAQRPRG